MPMTVYVQARSLPSMATRSVTSVAPGRAAARSSLPFSQRSTSWTAWVITILGIGPPAPEYGISDGQAVTGPAVDPGPYRRRVRSGKLADDRGPKGGGQQLEQRCVRARRCGFLHVCLPRLARLPIGDLDQDVGFVEHPVACAAKEAVLARSRCRDQAFEHTPEVIPPTGLGLQFDNRLDGHLVLPSCPSCTPAMLVRQHLPAGRLCESSCRELTRRADDH